MDFNDTPEEAAFRARVKQFLAANAQRRAPGSAEGYRTGQSAPGALARAKAWQARKKAAGFAGITWPKEWGGRGGTPDRAGDLQPGRSRSTPCRAASSRSASACACRR